MYFFSLRIIHCCSNTARSTTMTAPSQTDSVIPTSPSRFLPSSLPPPLRRLSSPHLAPYSCCWHWIQTSDLNRPQPSSPDVNLQQIICWWQVVGFRHHLLKAGTFRLHNFIPFSKPASTSTELGSGTAETVLLRNIPKGSMTVL